MIIVLNVLVRAVVVLWVTNIPHTVQSALIPSNWDINFYQHP